MSFPCRMSFPWTIDEKAFPWIGDIDLELDIVRWIMSAGGTVTGGEVAHVYAQGPEAFVDVFLAAKPGDLVEVCHLMSKRLGRPIQLPPPAPEARPVKARVPYGTCPFSVARDERFDDDDGQDRSFFAMLVVWADDYGRFEGDAAALSRETGIPPNYTLARLLSLERRKAIVRYTAPGRRRQVGEILGFDELEGQPDRRRFPAKRGGGVYPDRDGVVPLPRRVRGATHAPLSRSGGVTRHGEGAPRRTRSTAG